MTEEQRMGPPKFELNADSEVGRGLAVMSGKGGVGKSLITALTAAGLSRRGLEVGIMDADITGPSIPRMFGLRGPLPSDPDKQTLFPLETSSGVKVMSLNLLLENEDDPVVWRGPMIANVIRQFWEEVTWGRLDYMVVDLPPGTADAPLTVLQSLPLEGIIIVSSPQDLVAMVVGKAVKMAQMIGVPVLGLVENMSGFKCPDCGSEHALFGAGGGMETARRFGVPFLGALPLDPVIAALGDRGRIEDYESESADLIVDGIRKAAEPE